MSQHHQQTTGKKRSWSSQANRGLEANRRPAEELRGILPKLAASILDQVPEPEALRWRHADQTIRRALRQESLSAEEKLQQSQDLRQFGSPRVSKFRMILLVGAALLAGLAAGAFYARRIPPVPQNSEPALTQSLPTRPSLEVTLS
jgi:hypothetical protein